MYESEEYDMLFNAKDSLETAIDEITTGLNRARDALDTLQSINPELAELAEEGWYDKTAELFEHDCSPIKCPADTMSDIIYLMDYYSNPLHKECYFKLLTCGPFKGYIREEDYIQSVDPILFDFMESMKILSTIYGFDNTLWYYDKDTDTFKSVESDPESKDYFRFPTCEPIKIDGMKIKTYQIKFPEAPWVQIMPIPETLSEE